MMFNDPIDTIDPQLLLKQIHYKEEFILSVATLEDLRKHYTGSVLLWLFEDRYKSGDGKNKIVLEYGEERKYLEGKDLAAGIKCINAPAHLVLLYPDIIGLSHDQGLIRAVAEKKCTLTAARYPGGRDLIKRFIFSMDPNPHALEEYEKRKRDGHRYEEFLFSLWNSDVCKILDDACVDRAIIDRINREVRYEKYLD